MNDVKNDRINRIGSRALANVASDDPTLGMTPTASTARHASKSKMATTPTAQLAAGAA